jgi:phosphatidyl-myo-inositol alpha-mannosyltransferase
VRIGIVSDYLYPVLGGISEHVDGQARALVERGHEVTVITGRPLHVAPVRDAGVPVPPPTYEIVRMGLAGMVYVPGWGNHAQTFHTIGLRLARRLGRFYAERGFDVLHFHAPYNPSQLSYSIEFAPDDAIVVATFHSVFPQTTGMDIHAAYVRPAMERLDGRICVSEACIGSLAPYFPYAYDVIPNGIDADHFSPDAEPVRELLGDHRNIVFVGRFDPRNGLDTMLAAYRLLFADRGPGLRLIVVGDGPLRPYYLRQLSDDVRPYVHFAGRLNRTRPNHIVSGDVFCTPCNKASFGMVLLEAMSCGRAVAASRISGFQLLMDDGEQGILVHPADAPERFASALARLLDDDDLCDRMAAAGRRTALERYAWPHVAAELEAYYHHLLAGTRSRWASVTSSPGS